MLSELIASIFSTIESIGLSYQDGMTWLKEEYLTNDFLVGTTVPAILLGLVYGLRGFIMNIFRQLKNAVMSTVTVNTDNEYYFNISEYVFQNFTINFFKKNFVLSTKESYDIEKNQWRSEVLYTPGYGNSYGFYKGRPVILNREISESDSSNFKETLTIRIIGSRKSRANHMLKEFSKLSERTDNANVIKVFSNSDSSGWSREGEKPKRRLDTVIIPQDKMDYIVSKIDTFLSNEQWCMDHGVPWHLGIILYGPPGTGKTSLIHALASKYNRDLYLNTSSSISAPANRNSILVIEDIDATNMNVKDRDKGDGENNSFVSMSSILNMLDGIITPHGLITIATTNKIENLDPALIRPGRFDVQVELTNTEWSEWVRLSELFGRTPVVDESQYKPISPSKARYAFMYYTDDQIRELFY